MRASALRSRHRRRIPDERARRHLDNRFPQAGTADAPVAAAVNNAFAPTTITIFVPPAVTPTTVQQTTVTTPATTDTPPPPAPATTSATSSPPPPAPPPPATTSSSSSSSSSTSSSAPAITTSTAGNGNGNGNSGSSGTTPRPSVSVVPPGQSSNPPSSGGAGALPGQNGAIQTSSGLSTGAIVGIVVAILVVLIAAAVFFLRRKNIFDRKKRRATWLSKGGIMGPKPISGYDTFLPTTSEKPPPPPPAVPYNNNNYGFAPAERNTYIPGAATEAAAFAYSTNDPVTAGAQQQTYALPAPPSMAYGMPTPTTAQSPVVVKNDVTANVVCTFIPTLPDELSIGTGDVVRILAEYDDGWALCANLREEQGMVPLECLDRSGTTTTAGAGGAAGFGGQRDTREYRRVSSLAGGGGSPLAPNRLN